MLAIGIRFLGGQRYHATPWDAHVNEGRVEWPPSPWRLVRTIVAAWCRHFQGSDNLARDPRLHDVVDRLAGALPAYVLPRRGLVGFHTRHYCRERSVKEKDKTLIFDAFLDLGTPQVMGWHRLSSDGTSTNGAPWHAVVIWPDVDFSDDELRDLDRRLGSVNYFGRAESLAELAVVLPETDSPLRPGLERRELFLAEPIKDSEQRAQDPSTEVVQLLAPMSPKEYAQWVEDQRSQSLRQEGGAKRRRRRSGAGGSLSVPDTILEAVMQENDRWRKAGWSRPPGSRWVAYPVPRIEAVPVRRSVAPGPQSERTGEPSVARFAVHGAVLPSLRDAVAEADKLRRMLMGRSRGPDGLPSPVFSGKNPDGSPLEGHRHAFFLAEANEWPERRGTITHFSVYAPKGFDEQAMRVFTQRLSKLWGRGGYDVDLILLAVDRPESLAAEGPDDIARGRSPLFASSEVWVSRTPFVPTLHPRTNGRRRPGGGNGRGAQAPGRWAAEATPCGLRARARRPAGGRAAAVQRSPVPLPTLES